MILLCCQSSLSSINEILDFSGNYSFQGKEGVLRWIRVESLTSDTALLHNFLACFLCNEKQQKAESTSLQDLLFYVGDKHCHSWEQGAATGLWMTVVTKWYIACVGGESLGGSPRWSKTMNWDDTALSSGSSSPGLRSLAFYLKWGRHWGRLRETDGVGLRAEQARGRPGSTDSSLWMTRHGVRCPESIRSRPLDTEARLFSMFFIFFLRGWGIIVLLYRKQIDSIGICLWA